MRPPNQTLPCTAICPPCTGGGFGAYKEEEEEEEEEEGLVDQELILVLWAIKAIAIQPRSSLSAKPIFCQNFDAKTLTRVKKLTPLQRKSLFLKDKKRVHFWHDDCIYISEGKKSSLKSLIWRATK